jgi:hypothetical protein
MLDCYVYVVFSIVMYVLYFLLLCMCCIFYMPDFGDSLVGEADKIGKKIKKFMFIGYVHQLTDVHNLCSSVE